ncbi:helix-turn-helix domain-containing protein [Sandaracinobacteroides saxicola]|uniref:Helix-turn-helix transcriptional regulator n=1 Tax=Sandaracinobacteroides saxicola TaxID=2759707 RepID=A0A7G5IGJ0_9SPHN|nr:helix-turn-helix transcriptional regulator [Sandaracinobacteroides saxicola]QMW22482.1 helix-turn-helix transcriptional regulator [Sandaracinobacteroides saxicola]
MTSREIFARNLKALRKAQKLSQEELAHRAGLDRTYVSALERQVYSPTLDAVDKVAKVFNVSPASMLENI